MSIIEQAAERLAAARRASAAQSRGEDSLPTQSAEPTAGTPRQRLFADGAGRLHVPPTRVEDPAILLSSRESEFLLSPEGGRSRTAEEFRLIKRPLLDNAFERPLAGVKYPNLLMVSSSVQGEGKTFTSLNLAISITMEMDSTVLLIDADVAKPGLSTRLGIRDRPGLIERLVDESMDLSRFLLKTDIPKLTVLPAGGSHKRSTELLASGSMRRLLSEVASRYPDRIVLFDSPPVLETTEAGVLASLMGQVVLVVEHNSTAQGVVLEALARLGPRDHVFLVLNKCKGGLFSGKSGYGYGYGYGYGSYGEPDGQVE